MSSHNYGGELYSSNDAYNRPNVRDFDTGYGYNNAPETKMKMSDLHANFGTPGTSGGFKNSYSLGKSNLNKYTMDMEEPDNMQEYGSKNYSYANDLMPEE